MKVAAFPEYCPQSGASQYRAFVNSIPDAYIVSDVNDCDILVVWSVLWIGRMQGFKTHYDLAKQLGKPIIIMEIGAIQRGFTWRICIGSSLVDGLYWPKSHWQLNRRSILPNTIQKKGHIICVCGQNYHSENWPKNISHQSWIEDTVAKIKLVSDRPIEIRPHPRCDIKSIPGGTRLVHSQSTGVDSTDFSDRLQDYWCVVNFNSYPGIVARMAGVNACVDNSSLAASVSITDPVNVEADLEPASTDWLDFISHTEFTSYEIDSGFAWEIIQLILADCKVFHTGIL